MRCLLVSDLHYTLKQLDWVADAAPRYDVVILAGDHLDISSAVDVRVQIAVVLKYLQRLQAQTRLIVCSGNHDLDARNAAGEKYARWIANARKLGIPADEDSVELDGTLFTVCPWWDGPQTREQVAAQLAADAAKPRERWIWVYHAPPEGSPTCWDGTRHYGDADLTRWIEQYSPDIVLTGHIHQSPFRPGGSWADRVGSTWVFNAGRQIGSTPAHVVFDTDAAAAAWFWMDGAQSVRLDQPLVRPIPELAEMPAWLR
jgi:Icc-related predicted phosphoesterase